MRAMTEDPDWHTRNRKDYAGKTADELRAMTLDPKVSKARRRLAGFWYGVVHAERVANIPHDRLHASLGGKAKEKK